MAIPGVPNLLNPKALGLTLVGNLATKLFELAFPAPKWGIYIRGAEVSDVSFSSIAAVDMSAEAVVSDYPIESGSFVSYNKVVRPDLFRVEIVRDGKPEERELLLKWLERNKNQPKLFDVVVPERRWTNATLVSYRIARSANSGVAMLKVDCLFQVIQQLGAEYSASQIPDPENQPATPAARVNPVEDAPNSAGGEVQWQ